MHRRWVEFWEALSNLSRLQTNFVQPTGPLLEDMDILPPRYLFRAYDPNSPGINNDNVVGSAASAAAGCSTASADLLTLGLEKGNRKLCEHLSWDERGHNSEDDLVSWSTSLLFVRQYAIWRRHTYGQPPADVKILVLKTSMFKHLLMRDLWLFRKLRSAELGDSKMQSLVYLRHSSGYDNGEYLSQGLLAHGGYSSTTSLERLILRWSVPSVPGFR